MARTVLEDSQGHRPPEDHSALTFKDFETRTAIALYYYIHFRPHTSLGSTPAQAFYGVKPVAATAPPRALEGEVVQPSPIDIEFVGISAELPFLRRNN